MCLLNTGCLLNRGDHQDRFFCNIKVSGSLSNTSLDPEIPVEESRGKTSQLSDLIGLHCLQCLTVNVVLGLFTVFFHIFTNSLFSHLIFYVKLSLLPKKSVLYG